MHVRVLERLADLTGKLLGHANLEETLGEVAEVALDLLPADHASIRLEEDGNLRAVARAGVGADQPPPAFRRGEGVLGWVAETLPGLDENQQGDDDQRDPVEQCGEDLRALIAVGP